MNWGGAAAFAIGLCVISADAGAQAGEAEMRWLERIQSAPTRTNYTGVFVYQQGQQVQSSRVTHVADGGVSRERLEVLDGQPREFLRRDDEVRCLLPESRRVLIERSGQRDNFPAFIHTSAREIMAHYAVRKIGGERAAGVDSELLELSPRDTLRYGHRVWADRATGLPLKMQTLDDKGVIVEQIAFSEIRIGAGVDRALLKSRWNTDGWTVERGSTAPAVATPWKITSPIPGFKKVREVRRAFAGHPHVMQFVFSDGLAAVSVFIEPWRDGQAAEETLASKGAISMIARRRGEHLLTILGELPPAAVRLFADAVEFQPLLATP